MPQFYTDISRYGNNLLYRGYNHQGRRVQKKIKFKPTLYTKSSNNPEGWKSFDGQRVRPIEFDSMRDAKDFIEKYKNVENYEVFGMQNYIFQYITEQFPNIINYEQKHINVNVIDIEVATMAPKYDKKHKIKIRKT